MIIGILGNKGHGKDTIADYLVSKKNLKLFGFKRYHLSREDNIIHLFGDERVIFEECDLLDRGSLARIINISKPDLVYHFAAQSFPEASFLSPISTLTTNIIGTTNLLAELRFAKERNYCFISFFRINNNIYLLPIINKESGANFLSYTYFNSIFSLIR